MVLAAALHLGYNIGMEIMMLKKKYWQVFLLAAAGVDVDLRGHTHDCGFGRWAFRTKYACGRNCGNMSPQGVFSIEDFYGCTFNAGDNFIVFKGDDLRFESDDG